MVLGNWESILGLLSGAKMGAEGEGGLLRREKEEASCRPFGGAGRSLMPVLLPFVPNAPTPTLQLPLPLSSCGVRADGERKRQVRVVPQHPRPGGGR